MSKNKEKSNSANINLSFAILGILALGLVATLIFSVLPKQANAGEIYAVYNEPTPAPVENPTPAVRSISPDSANSSGNAITVNITGDGFIPSSVARWNGSNRPTTFIDRSHLLINLRAGDLFDSSGRYINVFNPGPGGGYSNAALFTIKGYAAPGSSGSSAPSVSTSRSINSYQAPAGEVMGVETSNENRDFSTLASNALYGSGTSGFKPSGLTQWLIFAILVLLVVIVVRKLYFENKYHSTPLKHA